jgi:hypothetical protein
MKINIKQLIKKNVHYLSKLKIKIQLIKLTIIIIKIILFNLISMIILIKKIKYAHKKINVEVIDNFKELIHQNLIYIQCVITKHQNLSMSK